MLLFFMFNPPVIIINIVQLKIVEKMSKQNTIKSPLINEPSEELKLTPEPSKHISAESNIDWHDFQYKQFGAQPQVKLGNMILIILVPVLIIIHIQISTSCGIPLLQYAFVTLLTAFIANYTGIIRKYELMPYLPVQAFDKKLKIMCMLSVGSFLMSMKFGWNGSGGMMFAIYWEQTKGSKMGVYGYYFLMIICGSLLMQNNYTIMKLVEFIPGLIFGYINSQLYKLKSSSTYAITHQFVFLCSICLPVFFPAMKLITPNILQWLVMIVCGFGMLVTVVFTIKLMQSADRVSVVIGVLSGVLMIGTSKYLSMLDYIGFGLITVGVFLLVRKEYSISEY